MQIADKYSPQEIESKWYDYWIEKRLFHSEPDQREPYTIVIPPPNVTGMLHMGHMLNNTLQDVLVGMMIALVVLLLSKYLLNWADGGKNRDWLLATIGIILSAAMLMYTSVKPYPMDVLPDGTLLVDPWDMVTDCYKAAGAMMGFCLGWVLERHFVGFDAKGAGKARMIRGVVGVALLLAVRKGLKAAGNLLLDAHWLGFAEMFGLMLFAIVLYPALFQWVEGRKSKS